MRININTAAIAPALLLGALIHYPSAAIAKPLAGEARTVQIGATDTNGQIFYLAESSQYAAYYGQLFKTPVLDRRARPVVPIDLTFKVTRTVGAPSRFRVLIVDVAGDLTPPTTNGGAVTFVPTTVLWESQDITIDGVTSPTPVTVTFTDLWLDAGHSYAFLLDAYVLSDGNSNYAELSGSASSYSDGYFFFLPNPAGTSRLANFGGTWISFAAPGSDLEFMMRFKAKPVSH
jgi:hypothetical protein